MNLLYICICKIKIKKYADKRPLSKVGKPSFLLILTGGQYAYRRSDGVFIGPIGCLKN